MTAVRPSTQLHPDGLADGNVLGLVGSTYGPAQAIKPVGLTGATTATRYVGGTTTGHPTSGTFVAGDFVVTADGHVWVCSTGGSPGTWVDIAGSGGGGVAVQDEGTGLGTATTMNFTGAGVTATFASGTATVNVPGGAAAAIPLFHTRSSGDITVTSTSYVNVDTALDIVLAATTGDVLEIGLSAGAANSTAGALITFCAFTWNGSATVNNTSGANDGPGCWRGQANTASEIVPRAGSLMYTVVAGDIFSGNVTLRLQTKVSSGTGTIYADGTSRRLQFWAKNHGH